MFINQVSKHTELIESVQFTLQMVLKWPSIGDTREENLHIIAPGDTECFQPVEFYSEDGPEMAGHLVVTLWIRDYTFII